uniref:Uncharacterized protein n=1 Tax=Panagrolaimus sp. ES5 TaxID=591445 RepID=A0AC34GVZ7_9BILA
MFNFVTTFIFSVFLFHVIHAQAAYKFGVDLSVAGSAADFHCFFQQGYGAALIQAYSPANGGSVDPNLIQNLQNSMAAGLGGEVYVTPTMSKDGKTQFDEVFNALTSLKVNTVWLQVTSPIKWSSNVQNNINLIQSFVDRALAVGVPPSIYTNWYDWQQITGSYTGFSNLRLWYWNNFGSNIESAANFDDFSSFGGWTKPAVKQFASNQSLCGLIVNRNVFTA